MISNIATRWSPCISRSIKAISRSFHHCARSRLVLPVGQSKHPLHKFRAIGVHYHFSQNFFYPSCATLHRCIRYQSQHTYNTKKSNPVTPLFIKAEEFSERIALIDQHGKHCYEDLIELSTDLGIQLQQKYGSLNGKTVCFLCENDISYVITKWAIWYLGGVAVPLCKTHPASELGYFIQDSQCPLVICTEEFQEKLHEQCQEQKVPLHVLIKSDYLLKERQPNGDSEDAETSEEENVKKHNMIALQNNMNVQRIQWNQFKHLPSLIIYTSGTTGRPKVRGSGGGDILTKHIHELLILAPGRFEQNFR